MSGSRSWGAHFLQYELAAGALAPASVAVWSEAFDGRGEIDRFVAEHGELLYTVAAPIDAAMLGFILAAAAIIVTAAPDQRMTLLRESAHYSDLWACFRSAMRFLGGATVVSLIGLAVTNPTAARIVFFGAVGLSVLAVLRVARCIWSLNWIIKIFTGPPLDRPPGAWSA